LVDLDSTIRWLQYHLLSIQFIREVGPFLRACHILTTTIFMQQKLIYISFESSLNPLFNDMFIFNFVNTFKSHMNIPVFSKGTLFRWSSDGIKLKRLQHLKMTLTNTITHH